MSTPVTKMMLETSEYFDAASVPENLDHRVKMAIAEMENRLHCELSLDVLAQSVNLSTSRFRHLFKTETGTTPAQYLKSLRMRRAKELVETTFLNIKEIMSSIGVRDKRHFAKDFERIYGLTPTQHRARCRGAASGSH